MTDLSGQTVLVTGANRGLGREFVDQLLARGVAKVYASARDTSTVASPVEADDRVHALELDVTDAGSIARAAQVATDVSMVVNNAGISLAASVLEADTTDLRRELEVNLFGPLAVTSAFLEGVTRRSGAIVNVASALAWLALGLRGLQVGPVVGDRRDAPRARTPWRQVLGVYMGYVDTDMTAGVQAPKASAADVVRQVLDGLEAGASEILADDTARTVRAGLHLSARPAALRGTDRVRLSTQEHAHEGLRRPVLRHRRAPGGRRGPADRLVLDSRHQHGELNQQGVGMARYDDNHKEATRARILDTSGRRFQERRHRRLGRCRTDEGRRADQRCLLCALRLQGRPRRSRRHPRARLAAGAVRRAAARRRGRRGARASLPVGDAPRQPGRGLPRLLRCRRSPGDQGSTARPTPPGSWRSSTTWRNVSGPARPSTRRPGRAG